jgi:hypothetical protein
MSFAAETPPPLARRLGNVAFWVLAGSAFAAARVRYDAAWPLLFAFSCFVRVPVVFNHPFSWAQANRPIGERRGQTGSFTPIEGVLSILGFLLMLGGFYSFATSLLK